MNGDSCPAIIFQRLVATPPLDSSHSHTHPLALPTPPHSLFSLVRSSRDRHFRLPSQRSTFIARSVVLSSQSLSPAGYLQHQQPHLCIRASFHPLTSCHYHRIFGSLPRPPFVILPLAVLATSPLLYPGTQRPLPVATKKSCSHHSDLSKLPSSWLRGLHYARTLRTVVLSHLLSSPQSSALRHC